MIHETRSGQMVSAQIGKMGIIDSSGGDFCLPDGQFFNIKNDSGDVVPLEVSLAGMGDTDFIETIFDVGWNPEIIKSIKSTSITGDLKWGY